MWRTNETKKTLFKIFNQCSSVIVLDTETTGLNPEKGDRVIQFSAIKYAIGPGGMEIDPICTFDKYINPEFSLPPKITEITGITDEQLSHEDVEDVAFPEIDEFLGNCPVIAAYNTPFDKRFISAMYERHGKTFEPLYELDVLVMARDLVDKKESGSHKLHDIATFYGVDYGLTFHNSFDDVTATGRLLNVFYKEYTERSEKPECEKLHATISSVHFWKGYNGKSRIYVQTNIGAFYFDIFSKGWDKKGDNPNSLEDVDMEGLRTETMSFVGVTDEVGLAQYRG